MHPDSAAITNPITVAESISTSLQNMSSDPYIIGFAMILLNLGGRFMALSVTPAQEAFLQNTFVRPLLLFAVMFIGTRNLVVAFWLTLVIFVFLHFLLNENSDWFLLRDWHGAHSAVNQK